MFDAYATLTRNSVDIQHHIPIMAERMEPAEAREYQAKDPLKAVWVFATGSQLDIQKGDWLVEEKVNPKRYAVLADAESFPDFHAEIPAERV